MENKTPSKHISILLSLSEKQVFATIKLLEEKSTIPFIARYRKEQTDGLDEVQIAGIKSELEIFKQTEERRAFILDSIEKQGKLTDELKIQIQNAKTLIELEDIYLPYKQKKKSRAIIARTKGLEPLAKLIIDQSDIDIEVEASAYIKTSQTPEESVETIEDALQGARDIIAEWINEDLIARDNIRKLFANEGYIKSKVKKSKEAEAIKFKDYFNSSELLKNCPSHRLLAMRRGETEGFLQVSISPNQEKAIQILNKQFVIAENQSGKQVKIAAEDAYIRLLSNSMENEFAKLSKEDADRVAIDVFALNLRQLLLAAPLGQKRVMGVDPAFRTGCKIVCLDSQGNLEFNTVIYPDSKKDESQNIARTLIDKFNIEAIAIGNGTASRETEEFMRSLNLGIDIFVISESGASVYSASEIAREEFPDKDITVRGAVSIGRRLMDPLAELVKVDPKAIGVGQYQHDVDQKKLKASLDQTVENCVNLVGVNLNTASKSLLTYVSGLGPTLAENIVNYRKDKGMFKSRKEIKKVPKLGPKAFEQCAGFLRITEPKNPLDNSAVHPESYDVVESMAKDIGCSVKDLVGNESLVGKININRYVSDKVGIPTLRDIISELAKPGRDPRGEVEIFRFTDGVSKIEDLEVGTIMPGIITNITAFGAFVDIGVHCDGLVHISQMADHFIASPSEVVTLHQKVKVKVVEVDIARKRVSLSMKV
jgi:protein Tex